MPTKNTVLLAQPVTETADVVFALVQAAARRAGVELLRASPRTEDGQTLGSIPDAMKRASLVVMDLTRASPEMMYELGLARAEQKPVIVIGSDVSTLPMAAIRSSLMLTYRLGQADHGFSQRLAEWIPKLIAGLDAPAAKTLAAAKAKQNQVFISYCHTDREYLDRLLVHLKPLQREGKVDVWADTRLRPGDKWKQEIEAALSRSTAAILLVSADFMASDFIANNELPPLLQSAEERGTRIFPLLVRASRYARDKNLKHFQAVNDPRAPVSTLLPAQQEAMYDSLAEQVEHWLGAA